MTKSIHARALLLGAATIALVACTGSSAPSESIRLNDNTQGYRITCGGAFSSVKDCYEQAGYLCGTKGYSVISESDIKPPGDSDYFWNAAAHQTVIRCNNNL
ncbi:MAG TPA: hypothetical protein VMV79_08225 [Alphaproteobacteria bacterium]|nr:hypothetical protein [Alphaproteobacteria bacterium]